MVGEDALRPRLHFSLMVRTFVVRMYWINVGLGVRVRVDGEDLCSTHVLSCIGSMLNASAITKLDVCHHTTSVDAAGTHQRAGERDQPYLGILRVVNKSTKWIKTHVTLTNSSRDSMHHAVHLLQRVLGCCHIRVRTGSQHTLTHASSAGLWHDLCQADCP